MGIEGGRKKGRTEKRVKVVTILTTYLKKDVKKDVIIYMSQSISDKVKLTNGTHL